MPLRIYSARNGFAVKRFSKETPTKTQTTNTSTIIKAINKNRTFANLFVKK